jgi:O-acetyl-ADP-ribose deacetylase (regulator of RNase III)
LIQYVVGDATRPVGDGPKIIAHVCNDEGKWGSGFVLAVSRRWKRPEFEYRNWPSFSIVGRELGAVQFVDVSRELCVANMVAQRGLRSASNPHPLCLLSLATCLESVRDEALSRGATVHMPRIGCGLGGATWAEVEPVVASWLCEHGVGVTVYDLEGGGR